MNTNPLSCPACGTVVGIGGGRCPQCGTPIGPTTSSAPPPRVSGLAPSIAARRAGNSKQALVAILMVVVAAVVIGGLLLLIPRGEEPAPSVASAAAPLPSASAAAELPKLITLSDGLPNAKTRARAWNQDAALISIEAFPVKSGFVDLAKDGYIEFVFATPKAGAMPGSAVNSAHYVIRSDQSGTSMTERASTGTRIAAEPTCTGYDAWTTATASGIDKAAAVRIRYQHDAALGRGIWLATVGDDGLLTRRIDGFSCAVIVR